MNEKLKQLYTLLEKMDWLSHAIEVINYDIETQAPKKGMEDDARDITFLSNERFRIHSSDEFRKLVKELKKEQDSLDTYNQRLITLLDRELTREDHITSDFDKERTELFNKGYITWIQAKEKNDYSLFKDTLKKILNSCGNRQVFLKIYMKKP